jgi:transcriptional regulator
MYVPPHFAETDLGMLHEFIERHSFGLIVSQVGGEPFATHIPLLLDRAAGPNGTLVGHVARANPQWRELAGQTALAVFSGPHAYVSPTWYESEKVVPTWNYVAVHASGPVQLVEDRAGVLDIVERSVSVYEANMPRPWKLEEDSTFIDRLLGQIIGFRIEIARIEGKWKLNQNHPAERREKVVAALLAQGDPDAVAVAELMGGTAKQSPVHRLHLLAVPGSFAVCKLPPGAALPVAPPGAFWSVTRTADELSVVCEEAAAPEGANCERGWRCLRVAGAMPFTLVGVLASLTAPIARVGVGVFAVSTFDTDYLLVKSDDFPKAVAALRTAGHAVETPEGVSL